MLMMVAVHAWSCPDNEQLVEQGMISPGSLSKGGISGVMKNAKGGRMLLLWRAISHIPAKF